MVMQDGGVNEHRGEFWLPDEPERRIGGLVRFGPKLAARLVLDGEPFPGVTPVALVHGFLFDGRRLSAIECYAAGRRAVFSNGEHVQQTVDVMSLLIGEHVGEKPRFDHLAVRLSVLREWANVRSGWRSGEHDEAGYSIRYETPPERSVTLRDGRVVALRTVDRLSEGAGLLRGEQETLFSVTFPKRGSLQDIGEAVASLQNLITFAARRVAKVTSLTVTCPGVFIAPGVKIPRPLELRTTQVDLGATDAAESVGYAERDFLFLVAETEAEFRLTLARWVALEERLGVVLDMFLALLYAPPHHLENKVMNVCQAAEGYHRRMHDYQLMPDQEYAALTEVLVASAPERWHSLVAGALANANGPSFKVRIAKLVEKAGETGAALASTFPNYPARVRNFRDRYVHFLKVAPTPREQVPEVADLYDTTKIILEVCLLQDIGWSAAEAGQAVAEKLDFQRLMRRPRVESSQST
jgi:hypothetical protein